MKQKALIVGVIALIIIAVMIVVYYNQQNTISSDQPLNAKPTEVPSNKTTSDTPINTSNFSIQQNVTKPENGYLPFKKNLTRIYLVDSNLIFVESEKDWANASGLVFVKKGDPYVLINGTFRSDYDKGYHFRFYGYIYNASGERVGEVLEKNYGKFSFGYCYLENHSTISFELRFKYNKTDVASYDIILGSDPTLDYGP